MGGGFEGGLGGGRGGFSVHLCRAKCDVNHDEHGIGLRVGDAARGVLTDHVAFGPLSPLSGGLLGAGLYAHNYGPNDTDTTRVR